MHTKWDRESYIDDLHGDSCVVKIAAIEGNTNTHKRVHYHNTSACCKVIHEYRLYLWRRTLVPTRSYESPPVSVRCVRSQRTVVLVSVPQHVSQLTKTGCWGVTWTWQDEMNMFLPKTCNEMSEGSWRYKSTPPDAPLSTTSEYEAKLDLWHDAVTGLMHWPLEWMLMHIKIRWARDPQTNIPYAGRKPVKHHHGKTFDTRAASHDGWAILDCGKQRVLWLSIYCFHTGMIGQRHRLMITIVISSYPQLLPKAT